MLLSTDIAALHWLDLRKEMFAGNSTPERQQRLVEALHKFSEELLWPFRIVLSIHQSPPVFYLVLNLGGQGLDEDIWQMNGFHREKDIIRLAVIFRNIYYSGHKEFEENGNYGMLVYSMGNVQRLMSQRGYTED